MIDSIVSRIAIRALSAAFDEFVAACVDDNGKPRAPSAKALAKARGYLPPSAKMAYSSVRAQRPQPRATSGPGCIVVPETDPSTTPYAGMYYDFGDGLHRLDRDDDGSLKAVRIDTPGGAA